MVAFLQLTFKKKDTIFVAARKLLGPNHFATTITTNFSEYMNFKSVFPKFQWTWSRGPYYA